MERCYYLHKKHLDNFDGRIDSEKAKKKNQGKHDKIFSKSLESPISIYFTEIGDEKKVTLGFWF